MAVQPFQNITKVSKYKTTEPKQPPSLSLVPMAGMTRWSPPCIHSAKTQFLNSSTCDPSGQLSTNGWWCRRWHPSACLWKQRAHRGQLVSRTTKTLTTQLGLFPTAFITTAYLGNEGDEEFKVTQVGFLNLFSFSLIWFGWFGLTRSCYVAQANLKPMVHLPSPPGHWDHWHVPRCSGNYDFWNE